MNMNWIDTHAHLAAEFQFSELDKFAELAGKNEVSDAVMFS